jgi:hypothetical protein
MPLVQANQKPNPGPSPRISTRHLRIELITQRSRLKIVRVFQRECGRLAIGRFPYFLGLNHFVPNCEADQLSNGLGAESLHNRRAVLLYSLAADTEEL